MRVFIPVLTRPIYGNDCQDSIPIMEFKGMDQTRYNSWIATLTRREQAKRWTAIPRKKKTT